MKHLGSLESTQEARVALSYALSNPYASFMLSKLPACFIQGVKLIFFSVSLLAPKFFKVVANSKEVGRHFQRQRNPFLFYAVIILEIKLGKRSLMCYKVDTRMDDMQCSSSPKSKIVSSDQS